jgi:Kef-type K+ transport system membrane component KefB
MAGADSAEMLPVLMGLAIILLGAKIGGVLAMKMGQPSVLGELAVGILLGNMDLLGTTFFEVFASNGHIGTLAELGVLLLLFEVGLESTVGQMLKTGISSLLVAILGVAVPMFLGWMVSSLLLPDAHWHTHVFVGATLTATSVGITARVLKDLGKSTSIESRIILGAAVIDDVLGLVVLSVVLAAVAAANLGETLTVAVGFAKLGYATLFLVGALAVGVLVVPRIFHISARISSTGMVFAMSLSFCFALSWGAGAIGLAPIIGAFAAGLALEDIHFRDFKDGGRKELEHLIHPLVALLAPVFFVTMGMSTDLSVFTDPSALLLAGVLIVAAIVGKQAASLGVVGRGIDRLTVGIGMIPRGEVGLIFVKAGEKATDQTGESAISPELYSALVIMVLVTTVVSPPLLKWSIARGMRARATGEHKVVGE